LPLLLSFNLALSFIGQKVDFEKKLERFVQNFLFIFGDGAELRVHQFFLKDEKLLLLLVDR